MRGTLTGDFGSLDAIAAAVESLGGTQALTGLSRELGNEALKQVAAGFRAERDPYGIPWFRKRYPDGRKTLDGATHQLAKSFSIKQAGPWGAVIGSSLARSRFQQAGTGLYGPKRSRIYPKTRKVMRFQGGGGAVFARSIKGQQQRRLVPVAGLQSPIWNRAFRARAKAYYATKLQSVARAAA